MRFMMMVRATRDSEAGVMPERALIEEMGRFNEELVKAGVLLAGEGLHPSARAARVHFTDGGRTVVDGPFPEQELIAGFWLIQVKSREEAVEWAKRSPNPMPGHEGVIELRQVFSAEDFGAALTPEQHAAEDRLRAEIAAMA